MEWIAIYSDWIVSGGRIEGNKMWDESQIGCEMTPELNDSLVIEYFLL